MLSFIVQARFLAHYAIPLVLPLGVLAAMGLERITTTAGNSRLLIPVALCALLSVAAAVGGGFMEFAPIARDHNRIRLVASPPVLAQAEGLVARITDQYFSRNLTVDELRHMARFDEADPLRTFGETCRAELQAMRRQA